MSRIFFVRDPGPYTTIQDQGRFGHVHMGVPVSGVLDDFAASAANLLVGNPEDRPVLEITFSGPELEALDCADISLTGAQMDLRINETPAAQWRSIRVEAGDRIRTGQAETGCRSYLAVTGGFSVPEVMGSCSTYVSAGIGGIDGRELRKEDVLERGTGFLLQNPRHLPWFPLYSPNVHVRAVPGPQNEFFSGAMELFFTRSYTVTDKANRMGYRLDGPRVFRDSQAPASIISEPSIHGNIQIPMDGKPIVLMVEQTIGGYAKIATVITPDLFRIAQARPGDHIRFHRVTQEEARSIYRQWKELTARRSAYFAL